MGVQPWAEATSEDRVLNLMPTNSFQSKLIGFHRAEFLNSLENGFRIDLRWTKAFSSYCYLLFSITISPWLSMGIISGTLSRFVAVYDRHREICSCHLVLHTRNRHLMWILSRDVCAHGIFFWLWCGASDNYTLVNDASVLIATLCRITPPKSKCVTGIAKMFVYSSLVFFPAFLSDVCYSYIRTQRCIGLFIAAVLLNYALGQHWIRVFCTRYVFDKIHVHDAQYDQTHDEWEDGPMSTRWYSLKSVVTPCSVPRPHSPVSVTPQWLFPRSRWITLSTVAYTLALTFRGLCQIILRRSVFVSGYVQD